jgi:hypothetical protein
MPELRDELPPSSERPCLRPRFSARSRVTLRIPPDGRAVPRAHLREGAKLSPSPRAPYSMGRLCMRRNESLSQ